MPGSLISQAVAGAVTVTKAVANASSLRGVFLAIVCALRRPYRESLRVRCYRCDSNTVALRRRRMPWRGTPTEGPADAAFVTRRDADRGGDVRGAGTFASWSPNCGRGRPSRGVVAQGGHQHVHQVPIDPRQRSDWALGDLDHLLERDGAAPTLRGGRPASRAYNVAAREKTSPASVAGCIETPPAARRPASRRAPQLRLPRLRPRRPPRSRPVGDCRSCRSRCWLV